MKNQTLRSVALLVTLGFLAVGMASATSISFPQSSNKTVTSNATTTTTEPFPTAGDAYCSATNGCGTIPLAEARPSSGQPAIL